MTNKEKALRAQEGNVCGLCDNEGPVTFVPHEAMPDFVPECGLLVGVSCGC